MSHHSPAKTLHRPLEKGEPDLGYSWVWTYGHLIPTAFFSALAVALMLWGAPWWAWAAPVILALWTLAGFGVMRFGVRMNRVSPLPAADFFPNGNGTVLDVGCGSGRMSIAVARARPRAKVVGLDNFSAVYIRAHGASNTERNFELAGIADRATIQAGDMREMPFDADTFDAAVSSAAIDHLQPDEIRKTLHEVNRVVVPAAPFLLMVIVPNIWLRIAFGPLIRNLHGRTFWRESLAEAGFRIEREGTARATALFLVKRP